MIKATTPTQAGFAQVFDTSGIVQYAAQKKAQRQELIQKERLEYDPKGIFRRDIPQLQKMHNELSNYISSNPEAFSNPSDNLEQWQTAENMKNRIRNFVELSKGLKEEVNNGSKQLSNEKWLNDDNEKMLANTYAVPDYNDIESAFGFTSSAFRRNTDIDWDQYIGVTENTAIDTISAADAKNMPDKYIVSKGKVYDKDLVVEALAPMMNKKSIQSEDIRYEYGDDVNKFAEDVIAMADKGTTLQVASKASDKAGSLADRKAEFAVTSTDTSNAISSKGNAYGYTTEVQDGRKTTTKNESRSADVGSESRYMYNINAPIALGGFKISEGINMDTGEVFTESKAKGYDDFVVTEIGEYRVSTQPIKLTLKGSNTPTTFHPGEALPPIEELQESDTDDYGLYVSSEGMSNDVAPYTEMAYGFASDGKMDFFELSEGQSTTDFIQSKGYQGNHVMIPLDLVESRLEGAVGYKTGKTLYDFTEGKYGTAPKTSNNTPATTNEKKFWEN